MQIETGSRNTINIPCYSSIYILFPPSMETLKSILCVLAKMAKFTYHYKFEAFNSYTTKFNHEYTVTSDLNSALLHSKLPILYPPF